MNDLVTTRHLTDCPDVLTPEEVQSFLSVGRNTVYNLLKSGDLKSIRIGKLYRIPNPYLLQYLNPCYNEVSIDD